MKAISLWQPWATLIAIGAKQIETRSWATLYRGPILIHAAKRANESLLLEKAICHLRPSDTKEIEAYSPNSFNYQAIKALYDFHKKPYGGFIPKLPLGCFLCKAQLVDIVRVEKIRDSLSVQERVFGNYEDGRFAWKLEDVEMFTAPIPGRGQQGIWEFDLVGSDDRKVIA